MRSLIKSIYIIPLAIGLSSSAALADQLKINIKATDLVTGQVKSNFGQAAIQADGTAAFNLSFPGPSGQIFATVTMNSEQDGAQLEKDQYMVNVSSASPNPIAIELTAKRILDIGLEYPILGGEIELGAVSATPTDGMPIASIIADDLTLAGSEIASLANCGRSCFEGKFGNGQPSIPSADIASTIGVALNTKVPAYQGFVSIASVKVGSTKECADFNGDAQVDGADLGALLGAFGMASPLSYDVTGDNQVDGADLAILLGQWGQCQ